MKRGEMKQVVAADALSVSRFDKMSIALVLQV